MENLMFEWKDNSFVRTKNRPYLPHNANFLIKSHYGQHDWSGFMTFAELEERIKEMPYSRPNGYYIAIEVR